MTNQSPDRDALIQPHKATLSENAGPYMELALALDNTLDALRVALKTAHNVATADLRRDDKKLHAKATEVAAVAEQLRSVCALPGVTNVPSAKRFEPLQPSHNASESWSGETTATASNAAMTTATCAGASAAKAAAAQPSVWSGFYNKTLRERFDVLALMYPRLQRLKQPQPPSASEPSSDVPPPPVVEPAARLGELPLRTANLMIENCIGVLGVPLGLGLNFVVDGKSLSVPMAVEEPSVVAAASSAAKLVAAAGSGFHTATSGNIMTSQIQLVDTEDVDAAVAAIAQHREQLLTLANTTLCPNMKKRGGGAVDIYCRIVSQAARSAATTHAARGGQDAWYSPCEDELQVQASTAQTRFLVVHIDVDVCEAMGANIVNTVAEGLSDEVARLTHSRAGLRILTNLCMQRRARSTFEIPLAKLGWKGVDGEAVARRVLEAYDFAAVDPFRAVTNNKGIMNGVDAAAVATGQDWRAIEAAAHCYASRSGQYTSLSHYEVGEARDGSGTRVLRGSLELPMAVGSKGGALLTHPGYTATHAILQQPTARELAGILVSVGLAQNFAAVRAIAVTGIQKGHMALHARNIAVAAGAPSELVAEVCSYMLRRQAINVEAAKEYLHAHAVFSELQSNSPPSSPSVAVALPSMFFVEIPTPDLEGTISLNIAFEAIGKRPQYIAIRAPSDKNGGDQSKSKSKSAEPALTTLHRQLLGDKGYSQLEKMFLFLASMRSIVISDSKETPGLRLSRANTALQNKLQLLSILINIIAYRLMEVRPRQVRSFLRQLLDHSRGIVGPDGEMRELDATRLHDLLMEGVEPADEVLATGLPLFLALWQVLHYHIEQDVPHRLLRARLAQQQWALLNDIVRSYELDALTDDSGDEAAATQAASEQPLETRFLAYVAVQATRWQATLLLLIDSLALAAELVTPERLDFLTRIGEYMEWEGSIAHDLARYPRDASERVPNAYLFWLSQRGIPHQDGDKHEREFRAVAERLAAAKWEQLLLESRRDKWAASAFSLPAVERVIGLIREIYGDRGGRKESF